MRRFLADQNAPHLHVVYEDLQLSADRELARLSKFLEAPVTLGHLLAIHDSGRLNRRKSRNQGLLQSSFDPREKLSRTAALRPPGLVEAAGIEP